MTEHDTSDLPPTFIAVGHGLLERQIAVRARAGGGPGLFWLSGFHSDMRGTKAAALDAWAAEHNRACVRFDYSGHGESGGAFEAGTIGRWLEESVAAECERLGVPVNALHTQGYASIGCEPCTRAVQPGEPERSGRWWWESDDTKECGLHMAPAERTIRTKAA